jgi:hypothetical protein
MLDRRALLAAAPALALAPKAFGQTSIAIPTPALGVNGRVMQGGFIIGRTAPRAAKPSATASSASTDVQNSPGASASAVETPAMVTGSAMARAAAAAAAAAATSSGQYT